MTQEVKAIIERFQLQPHPEGGYFRETYRSEGHINQEHLPHYYHGQRNYATCIYFLLTGSSFSAFHRLPQDEIWHFYAGTAVHLHIISPAGAYSEAIVGNDISSGQHPQFVVPGSHWFAASVATDTGYALVGCTVAPGFDFQDFELAKRHDLILMFPQHQELIEKYTRE